MHKTIHLEQFKISDTALRGQQKLLIPVVLTYPKENTAFPESCSFLMTIFHVVFTYLQGW